MSRWRLVAGSGLIAAFALAWPVSAGAQVRSTDLALAASQNQNPSDAEAPPVIELDPSRVEFSLGAYVGRPGGYIRVGEHGNRGTKMRLNDDLGVSFIPVREALRRLEGQGLVVTQRGKSASVVPLTHQDLHGIYRLRRQIEPEIASRSCLLLRNDDLERLDDVVKTFADERLGVDQST